MKILFPLFVAILLVAAAPTFAQDKPTAESPPPASTFRSPAVDLVPGEDGGSINFVVNGAPVAWLDAEGLHVVGNVDYGGTITDAGSASLRSKIDKMGGYHE